MEMYKAPKLKKIKKIKPKEVKSAAKADMRDPELPASKVIIKGKKGEKTPYYKSKNIGKTNIIDARAMTRETVKEGLAKKRLQNAVKENKAYKDLFKKMK